MIPFLKQVVNMSKEKEMLDELKQIRELLSTPPPPPPPKNLLEEFKHFLKSYKVIGLAVAFIMGIYLGALIGALVTDLVMPIVEFFPWTFPNRAFSWSTNNIYYCSFSNFPVSKAY